MRENTPSSTGETPTPQSAPHEPSGTTTTEVPVEVESQTPVDVNQVSEGNQKPGDQGTLKTTTEESKPVTQGVTENTTQAPVEETQEVQGDSQSTPVEINQVSKVNSKPEAQEN